MSSTALTIIPHKIQKKKNSLKSTDELTPKQKLFAEIYVANFGKITKQEAYEKKDERLKLFEGSGTKDVGTWSPVMELPFPFPASRHNSPVPASRSVFPFVEIFDFIKNKHRL
jgi:hypothetical protein